MSTASTPPRRHRALPMTLIAIGTLLAFLTIFALWANRQLLNTDNWTTTSSQLLEKPAVRDQLATTLVNQLYANVDVTGEIRQALPPRAQPLAAPAAGALRSAAETGVQKALATSQVQSAWEEANRRAHRRFLQVIDGGGAAVSTTNGVVTINLAQVLQQASNRIGAGGKLAGRLPPDAGQITVMKSDQLSAIQKGAKFLRHLPIVLLLLTLLLWSLAVWRAGAWRRQAVRAIGIGLFGAGVAALVVHRVAGTQVVDALATTEAAKPAVQDVWDVATTLLSQAAGAAVLYGIVVVLGAWLTGTTAVAVSLRNWMAPYLRDPGWAYGSLAFIAVLVAWWGPTPATRNAALGLILLAFAALGVEALRRKIAHEHPEMDREMAAQLRAEKSARLLAWFRGLFGGRRAARPATANGAPTTDELERLARLHDTGVLDDEEFARAKASVIGPRELSAH
jgi:putative oligomerization/nucleic acid binding protein